MNCEEYRESIAADPSFDGGAGHLTGCAECQAYRSEMQALDEQIKRALVLEVPDLVVPELPEIVTAKSDNVVALRRRQVAPRVWFAMAATIVVAALIGIRIVGTDLQYDSLGEEILAHLDHEPFSLRVTDIAVTDAQLNAVVPRDVARLDHSAGLITYAQSCPIRGHDVPHLVIQGEYGPITILLMPEEAVSGPETIHGENINGVILPVGNGSIAIIGESEERLDRIQERVLESVTWST
jgi:hypothetical protein